MIAEVRAEQGAMRHDLAAIREGLRQIPMDIHRLYAANFNLEESSAQ